MNKKKEDPLMEILFSFDNAPKSSPHDRRAASKYLWDFFMKLLVVVGVQFCNYERESLKIAHLKTRWNQINRPLSTIEKTDRWNGLIKKINKIREKVEHDDFFSPEMKDLNDIRKQAPLFKEWIINLGRRYFQSSKSFTLTEYFRRTADFYISQSEIILANFGIEKIPYVARYVYEPFMKGDMYFEIPKLKKIIEKRRFEIINIDDISESDLESLINLVEITSKINAWEEALLKDKICPKCGGDISQSQHNSPHAYDEPPDYVYVRVGCNDCDYEVMSESYSI